MFLRESIRSRMDPKIHNAWAGQASCPAAERVRRTSVPKSITGSKVFRPITSLGCRWRITVEPSRKVALRIKHPWSPLLSKRSWVNPNFRQPQGHARVWDPQACKAHGALDFSLRRYRKWRSSLIPKACISIKSKARFISSSCAQRRTRGMTCWTSWTSWNIGHCFKSMGPKSGEDNTHHDRCRRQGQMWSNLSSTWRQWKPVHFTKCSSSPFTKLSLAAGETHSNTTNWAWRRKAVLRVFGRLLALESSLLLSSPSLENGWQLNPDVIVAAPEEWRQISHNTSRLPTSPQMTCASQALEYKSSIFWLWSTATWIENPEAKAPCARPPNPEHKSTVESRASQEGLRCPRTKVSLFEETKAMGNCWRRTPPRIVKAWNSSLTSPSYKKVKPSLQTIRWVECSASKTFSVQTMSIDWPFETFPKSMGYPLDMAKTGVNQVPPKRSAKNDRTNLVRVWATTAVWNHQPVCVSVINQFSTSYPTIQFLGSFRPSVPTFSPRHKEYWQRFHDCRAKVSCDSNAKRQLPQQQRKTPTGDEIDGKNQKYHEMSRIWWWFYEIIYEIHGFNHGSLPGTTSHCQSLVFLCSGASGDAARPRVDDAVGFLGHPPGGAGSTPREVFTVRPQESFGLEPSQPRSIQIYIYISYIYIYYGCILWDDYISLLYIWLTIYIYIICIYIYMWNDYTKSLSHSIYSMECIWSAKLPWVSIRSHGLDEDISTRHIRTWRCSKSIGVLEALHVHRHSERQPMVAQIWRAPLLFESGYNILGKNTQILHTSSIITRKHLINWQVFDFLLMLGVLHCCIQQLLTNTSLWRI